MIYNLYIDSVTKNGKIFINVTKDAPAPNKINIAGKAQQINVEDEANNEIKFADLSLRFIIFLLTPYWKHQGHWKVSYFLSL